MLLAKHLWSQLPCLALATLAGAASVLPTPCEAGEEGPLLAAPSQQLSDVLPLRVLDEITLPPKPLRVAARPTLDWQPGLKKATEQLAEQATETPGLKPVAEPPLLVAPGSSPITPIEDAPADDGAATAKPQLIKNRHVDPAEADLLPLQAPRNEETKPAPVANKPADKPAPPAAAPPVESKPAKSEPAEEPRQELSAKAPRPEKKTATTPLKSQLAKKKAPVPSEPPPPLTRGLRNLRSKMRTVLSFYYRKPLNTVEHNPWELMHSMLSYELHSRVRDGGPRSPYMTAVGHLCFNRTSKRQQMMTLTNGKIDTRVGVGLQGHRGQLLAMLAQCNVSPEYPIRVQGKDFTIRDLIESEQQSCYTKTELTFKLIGLGHYLDSDAKWLNEQGERWDIPRLIQEERAQPIRGAACGGTHRLAGLSLAFRRREARGEPLDGEYAEAAKFVNQYQGYAFKLQNEDGSLSTEWFRGRGAEEDIDRRLRTTGHLLEWLVYSLPESELRSYRTVRAANYLTNLLATNADHEWHLGSIAHAIHALVLYDKRVFRPHDQNADAQIAVVDPTTNLFREYPIYRNVMRNSPPEPSNFLGGLFGKSRASSSSNRRR